MKIRNGFVSNSSSSSFIISTDKFKSVRELATYMLHKKIEDEEDYVSDNVIEINENNYNNVYIERLNNIDENSPVCFPSCNYSTYIKMVGDVFFVSTCNNTNWELFDYSCKLTENSTIELLKIQKNFNETSGDYREILSILDNDYEDFGPFGKDYYDLQYNIIGVETNSYCKKCHKNGDYSYLYDTTKYGLICLKCDNIHKRKDKLDKINKFKDD